MRNIKEILDDWENGKIEVGLYTTIDENNDNVIVEITNDYLKLSTAQKMVGVELTTTI